MNRLQAVCSLLPRLTLCLAFGLELFKAYFAVDLGLKFCSNSTYVRVGALALRSADSDGRHVLVAMSSPHMQSRLEEALSVSRMGS